MRTQSRFLNLHKQKKKIDLWIVFILIFLSFFGMLMIFEASNVAAFRDFGDKYYYVKKQLVSFGLGLIGVFLINLVNYRKFYFLSIPLIIISLISLILVLIPGIGVGALGAQRWIDLNIINFQPSELTKLAVVLYLASWLSTREKGRFLAFTILLLSILGLVMLQPDFGTTVIIVLIAITSYFISQAPLWHFLILLPFVFSGGLFLALISPYRFNRLLSFFNPGVDPLGSSYHIRQILISLGSGGITGLGLGASKQKFQYLPEATTDSIFAIIAEEFGFIGSILIIAVFLFLLYRIYQVCRHAPDRFSMLLTGGILSLIGFQVMINLGAMTVLFPLTGIPLPFISYGGSNLIISMLSLGLAVNISRYCTDCQSKPYIKK